MRRLPCEGDAESGGGGFWKTQNVRRINGDEHLQREDLLHLSKSTGDDQRHETRWGDHSGVVARFQGVCQLQVKLIITQTASEVHTDDPPSTEKNFKSLYRAILKPFLVNHIHVYDHLLLFGTLKNTFLIKRVIFLSSFPIQK